jgi:hypothetical protein
MDKPEMLIRRIGAAHKQLFWGSGIRQSEARAVKDLREQWKQGFWAGY